MKINLCVSALFQSVEKYVWFKYDLGQKHYAPQVRPHQGSNSWPPDYDNTFHVTEMPALTTQPSVTSLKKCTDIILGV